MPIQIAIDGPSGSGKSTLAKNLAKELGFVYIDTGALYRTVGLYASRNGIDPDHAEAIVPFLKELKLEMRLENGGNVVYLDGVAVGDEIRTSLIAKYASQVSKVPEVRAFLLETQRSIARVQNVIMDGRDIGTVVLPDAQVKIFLEASPEARARRRLLELAEKGENVDMAQVLSDMQKRDENDRNRSVAPAIPAKDAIFLDTSDKTREETVCAALDIISAAVGNV